MTPGGDSHPFIRPRIVRWTFLYPSFLSLLVVAAVLRGQALFQGPIRRHAKFARLPQGSWRGSSPERSFLRIIQETTAGPPLL